MSVTPHDAIAITGMACRFPGAASLPQFWSLLREGRHGVGGVPLARWNADEFFDADSKARGKTNSRFGGFIEDIEYFDAGFFGISPREATQMDPQQRILLELASEALEDAGIAASGLAGSDTAVFVGAMTNDYLRHQLADNYQRIDVHTGSGAGLCMLANRISYQFDLRGPSVTVDTACSSSLVAVFQACQALWTAQSDVALAAGVNLILDPAFNIFYTKAGLSAADGRCKTFSDAADGIGRAEGAGVVVLKRLQDAFAAGDLIYAVIRGGAVNHDGRSNGLTQPNRWAQEQLLRRAFAHAGVRPGDPDYIELHGTGTLIGDPIEANALGAVFADGRSADAPCEVGSVKSNLGHAEAAAGIAGLIKLALSLAHAQIPPSLCFDAPNPHIDFERLQLRVNTRLKPWPARNGRRVGGISSFGLGGANAHLVLESAASPAGSKPAVSPASPDGHWLMLSARSAVALRSLAQGWLDFLKATPDGDIERACSSALRRRAMHDFRLCVLGVGSAGLCEGLQAFVNGTEHRDVYHERYRPALRRVLFAVPEPTRIDARLLAQHIAASAMASAAWNECRAALLQHAVSETGRVVLPTAAELVNCSDVSANNDHFRAWCFAAQYALLQHLSSVCIDEGYVAAGLGQLAALCQAGVLTLSDAVCWLYASLSPEFAEQRNRTTARYTRNCEFSSGRNPDLTTLQWHTSPDDWTQRLDRAAQSAPYDVIALTLSAAGETLFAGHGDMRVLQLQTQPLATLRIPAMLALRHSLQWAACAEDRGFIRLPAYPWQRQSFWLSREERAVPQPADSSKAYSLLGVQHDPSVPVWQINLRTDELAFLTDHQVQGSAILPGAACGEIGFALHRQLSGQSQVTLERLEFHQPFALEPGVASQLSVHYDAGAREYQVRGAAVGAVAAQNQPLLARGFTGQPPAVDADAIDLQQIRQRCSHSIDVGRHYRELRQCGLEYGARFQNIRRLWRAAGEEVLAWIESHDAQSQQGFCAHPALLDAAFQTLLAVVDARARTELYVPVAIERLTLRHTLTNGFWCHGRLTRNSSGELHGELSLFDLHGRVLLEVRGLQARVLSAAGQTNVLRDIDQWLYDYAWENAAAAPADAVAGDAAASWLIITDDSRASQSLCDDLRSSGAASRVRSERGAALANAADLQRLLQTIDSHPAERIVYFAPSDASGDAPGAVALQLIQALAARRPATLRDLTLVTRGAFLADAQHPASLTQASLIGLLRVARNEHPDLHLRIVDIEQTPDQGRTLFEAIVADAAETEVAVRGGQRRMLRLVRRTVNDLEPEVVAQPIRADASYLITGGFGGFGLALAAWLVQQGARHLVLVGRRGPDSKAAQRAVSTFERAGVRVLAAAADISRPGEVQALFETLSDTLPPLKGVFHAAAVLHDVELAQLDRGLIEKVMAPKAEGAWRLHQHTRTLALDHFVLFSSIAGMLGNPGQASYAMACTCLDSLAQQRRASGLPAISVSWGPLAEVGMAARNATLQAHLTRSGARPFSIGQVMQLMGRILGWRTATVGVAMLDWSLIGATAPALSAAPMYRALLTTAANADAPPPLTPEVIETILTRLLAETLQVAPQEIDGEVSLLRLGIDSLMALDLQIAVEQRFGVRIAILELMKGNSLKELCGCVEALLAARQTATGGASPTDDRSAPATPPSTAQGSLELRLEDAQSLMTQLHELSEEEMDHLLQKLSHTAEASP